MIISPDVLSEVERESRAPDAALRSELALEVSPEALKAVNMPSLPVAVLTFRMINQSVDVPLHGDTGIPTPPIGVDRRSLPDLPLDEGVKVFGFNPVDQLSPDLPVPTQDTEGRLFRGATATFSTLFSGLFPPVFPLSAQVRFVHLDDPAEHGRHIEGHRSAEKQQEFKELILRELNSREDEVCGVPQEEFLDDLVEPGTGNSELVAVGGVSLAADHTLQTAIAQAPVYFRPAPGARNGCVHGENLPP